MVGLAAAGATMLGVVPTASGASLGEGEFAAAGRAPNCIVDKEDKGKVYTTVWVTNKCTRIYRVKLIMARGADSRCFSIEPGQTRSHTSRGVSPYLDRIETC